MDKLNDVPGIAVIGMSGEFPGAKNVEQYWQNICNKVDSVELLTEQELLDLGASPEIIKEKNFVPVSNRLEDVELFDADFFGFVGKEASIMDPQQRRLLEQSHLALEDAGYCPQKTRQQIGIYAGVGFSSYLLNNLLNNKSEIASVKAMQLMIANDKDYASTRVAYKLGLTGPSVNMGTACSTSLVAIHLACRALLGYETDIALAGAVKVDLIANLGQLHQSGGIFSSDGRTRTFDARADGTTFGDGAGMVVLKRLEEAIEDGDHIYAVIKGSAINNDGSDKIGYTAPSIASQAEVISIAQEVADVSPQSIQYVEAHGTATPLGDPIEIAALTRAFREKTDEKQYCAIGSSKSNIGHLDSASGMAGLIKTVKAIEHAQLPPSLYYETPNPEIDFENSPFFVNTELQPWPGLPRRAGVSAFGVGGTNAHLVLEQAPPAPARRRVREAVTLHLSAKNKVALEQNCLRLGEYLARAGEPDLGDVAYTLRYGRGDYSHRYSITCENHQEAIAALTAFNEKKISEVDPDKASPVYFMFSGQGTQHLQMAADLYAQEPLFTSLIDRCADLLQPELELDIREVLYGGGGDSSRREAMLNETRLAQPVIFAIEYALAKLWMSWGIQPKAMIGHSLGEYTAACLAGVFSLEDALKLVAFRGAVMQAQTPGDMVAVALDEEALQEVLLAGVSIAAVNGQNQCVISGPAGLIREQVALLENRQLRCSTLNTSHAFHSQMMQPASEALSQLLADMTLNAPAMRYVSNVTGKWITRKLACDPQYYIEHMLKPVRFYDGIALMAKLPGSVMLEIGPGHTLTKLARRALGSSARVVPSLNEAGSGQGSANSVAAALGLLWSYGVPLDWDSYYQHESLGRVPLPGYAFQKKKYWIEPLEQSPPSVEPAAPGKKEQPKDWFYTPSWQQSLLPPGGGKNLPGHVLILAREDQAWQALAEAMPDAIVVTLGESFRQLSPSHYSIRGTEQASYQRLFEALASSRLYPAGVINLCPLQSGAVREYDAAQFALDRVNYYDSLLLLADGLSRHLNGKVKVLTFTRGNCDVLGALDAVAPCAAMPVALATVINQEMPGLACRVLDIGDLVPGSDAFTRVVADEFACENSPVHLAYRAGQRWLQTYQAYDPQLSETLPPVHRDGVYVITGGLGNVGYALAQHLARQCAPAICFVARSPLPPRSRWPQLLAEQSQPEAVLAKIRKVMALQALGARVSVYATDVSEFEALNRTFEQIRSEYGAINGVIHGAGHYAFATIDQITANDADLSFAPKVQGLMNLAEVTRDLELDFAILLSSVSSMLGGLGYAAYASANAFMDGYCRYLRASGRNQWLTVNWDAWQSEQQGEGEGSTLMKTAIAHDEGEQAFDLVLRNCLHRQLVVSTTDLNVRMAHWSTPKAAEKTSVQALEQSVAQGLSELEKKLLLIWHTVFGMSDFGIDDNFFELGGDSLLGMSLVTEIQKAFGVSIYIRAIFEAPSVGELAGYFEKHYPEEVAKLCGETLAPDTGHQPLTWQEYRDLSREATSALQFDLPHRKVPGTVVFVLSPPRSGSTLLRVMLAGNSALCAPPELELLCFNTLSDRDRAYGEVAKYRNNGLLSLIENAYACDEAQSQEIMEKWRQGDAICGVYADIQERLQGRFLVDKSPVYSHSLEVLRRAEQMFENAVYINLQRHPGGMINSYRNARLDLLTDNLDLPPLKLGELQWNMASRAIGEFLTQIPAERQFTLQFEALLQQPEQMMRRLCGFLGIDYDPGMLTPYADQGKRMTKEGMQVGDPNFHLHKGIDASVGEKWQNELDCNQLADFTLALAREQGYVFAQAEAASPGDGSDKYLQMDSESLDELDDSELDSLLKELGQA
ncbi:type I polyketide synthase [Thalassomonas viridans]|uniref:Type I polyketide synthase n=1 Tax=Thalassomonas viridans TaxID=137584 RepID=A0AAE9ZF84_9GAMM|nr:type I polyketide synthase [Thalassomonas viridans]WDE09263.1 type I polyketide synthase [Thalassomonas viridans]